MANAGDIKVDSLKRTTITMGVSLTRWFHVRVRVGIWLMRLGAWITGAECKVEQRAIQRPHCAFCGRASSPLVWVGPISGDSGETWMCQSCQKAGCASGGSRNG